MTLPTRRLRPARLLWLGWGLGALAVLAGSAVLVAERLEVPTSRSFGGRSSETGLPVRAVIGRRRVRRVDLVEGTVHHEVGVAGVAHDLAVEAPQY